jgi:formylglycine-generating enzyme required for sulfatase activity
MRPILITLLLSGLNCLFAGPIPIQPITHEWHEPDYYATQASEWRVLATTPGNCDDMAWYHYYLAAHFANIRGYQPVFNTSAIHQEAERVLNEDDFALHYLRCRQSATPKLRWENLLKAYEVEPERVEAYPGLAIYYMMKGDQERYKDFMRLIDARNPFPGGAVEWSYNQLQSVEQGGVLLTHGDNDTYATLMLQAVYDLRTDVAVINLSLFTFFPEYRQRVMTELALPAVTFSDSEPTSAEVLATIVAGKRPVYLGVGAHDDLISELADRMYLTGLTFRYAEDSFNNLGILVDNYRNAWRLDELHRPLETGARRNVADLLNQNYLPALLELRNHFQTTDPAEALKLETTVRMIARRNGLEGSIERFLLPEPPQLASDEPGLKAKTIAKKAVLIPAGNYFDTARDAEGRELAPREKIASEEAVSYSIDAFYLQETEVSNADYQLFLEDLLRQRKFEILDTVAIVERELETYLPTDAGPFTLAELYGEDFADQGLYPVTNISRRAAELYAIWLGQVYNQDPKRKDGRKVSFRLPSREEWSYATRGGKKYAPFSWGGPYIANAKGCFLANFNTLLANIPDGLTYYGVAGRESTEETPQSTTSKEVKDCCENDGAYLTVPVASYYPNDYGLYNTTGNAAEMTSEKDIDTGGSWLDHPNALLIGRVMKRSLPHPAVGFRLVMEYVD